MTSKEMVARLSLEEKAGLCSGQDFWTLKSVERLGLKPVMVTDGPHGLRKQADQSDHLGINRSVPATCFPAACASSCSFDRDLLREIGAAMGEECRQEQVGVILGPAANIKRSPLCGRNFEYISEDPYLTGEAAAALIEGVQSRGVGTSLKHYAANNQEKRRMTVNSVVDERALREIYLAGFEGAVRKAGPWTLMCSYNRVNGVYASVHKELLSDILRDEWGFQGLVMTDWGAMDDRVEGVRAGLDLEMPGSGGVNDAKIVAAVRSGALEEGALDRVAVRVVDLVLKSQEFASPGYRYDAAAHHAIARKAAAQSAVLLRNEAGPGGTRPEGTDRILPLQPGKSLAVIGAFARTPRYQGAGSSKINPLRIDSPFDALNAALPGAEYAAGYSLGPLGLQSDEALIKEAAALAARKDVALVFAGLPDEYESEGFDRLSMDMPASHNALIEAVAAANPNTVVVLQLGSPVSLPWRDKVRGILLAYLGGQAVGSGLADLLTGAANPSGKLAETWPLALADTPSYRYFPGGVKTVEYRESIFVGYRYYDTAGKPVAYPFGHGLSYTGFEYSNLQLDRKEFSPGGLLRVSFRVKNTGNRAGAEAAQLYVAAESSRIYRARKELKGFEKISLEPGQSKLISMTLDARSFAYYNAPRAAWSVEGGKYCIMIGASSQDIRLKETLSLAGDGREAALATLRDQAPEYFNLKNAELVVSGASFGALYGRPLPPGERLPGEPYTLNSTLEDIKDTPIGGLLAVQVKKQMAQAFGGDSPADMSAMMDSMMGEMPLRAMMMFGQGQMTPPVMEAILDALNGRPNPLIGQLMTAFGAAL